MQSKVLLAIEPLFPIYLFERLSDISGNWFLIRSTRGVSQPLRFGNLTDPVEVSETIINCLKHRCIKEEPLYKLFEPRQLVEISQGPYKGFLGFFENPQILPNGLSRVLLLFEVLGSVHKFQIKLLQLRKLSV